MWVSYKQMEIRDLVIKCVLKKDIKRYMKAEQIEHGSQLLLRWEQLYQCEQGKNFGFMYKYRDAGSMQH